MVRSVFWLEQSWCCGSGNSIPLAYDLNNASSICKKIESGRVITGSLFSLGKFRDSSKHHHLANESLTEAIFPVLNILKEAYWQQIAL